MAIHLVMTHFGCRRILFLFKRTKSKFQQNQNKIKFYIIFLLAFSPLLQSCVRPLFCFFRDKIKVAPSGQSSAKYNVCSILSHCSSVLFQWDRTQGTNVSEIMFLERSFFGDVFCFCCSQQRVFTEYNVCSVLSHCSSVLEILFNVRDKTAKMSPK